MLNYIHIEKGGTCMKRCRFVKKVSFVVDELIVIIDVLVLRDLRGVIIMRAC